MNGLKRTSLIVDLPDVCLLIRKCLAETLDREFLAKTRIVSTNELHPSSTSGGLFPMLSDKELDDLGDDIAANGQVETVKLHRGTWHTMISLLLVVQPHFVRECAATT